MKIFFTNKNTAESILHDENSAIISISEPLLKNGIVINSLKNNNDYFYYANLNSEWKNILRLYFSDLEEEPDWLKDGITCDQIKLFNFDDAFRILEFVNSINVERLYIHCAAGISRSAAVAIFLGEIFECDVYRIIGNQKSYNDKLIKDYTYHNKLVYEKLEEVHTLIIENF